MIFTGNLFINFIVNKHFWIEIKSIIFRIERENINDLDPNLVDLLTSLLSDIPENRYNLQQIKVNYFLFLKLKL